MNEATDEMHEECSNEMERLRAEIESLRMVMVAAKDNIDDQDYDGARLILLNALAMIE